jgi:hypothetical protein
MAYIQRNDKGDIIAVSESAQSDQHEELPLHSAELISYLAKSAKGDEAKVALSNSDDELVRVLEDLINTLIDKKVILFTDLPFAAREKLSSREKIRGHLNSLDNLMADDEGIL